ncbi:MAG TPA: pyridoxamine 5'-phosphate oxidase family protein [Acidimicrobiales bacterium]|nr:pyridoxamine 5'-phosphate oxidase family protein [Acidimicrobiales bacterium]
MTSLVGSESPIGFLHLRQPPRVDAGTPVAEVARRMREDGVSLVFVGEDPAGVLTERDLVAALAREEGPDATAAAVASSAPVTATVGTPLGVATSRMLDHGIRHLVVVDDAGDPVGVLSLREAARMLVHVLDLVPPGEEGPGTAELQEITPAECLALLRAQQVGRLAVITGDSFDSSRPDIFPVNYAVGPDDTLVVRTDAGTKLASAQLWWVAFEVDGVDLDRRTGWSVVVRGTAREVTEAQSDAMDALRRLPLSPWAPGTHDRWLQVSPEWVSGRRIVAGG